MENEHAQTDGPEMERYGTVDVWSMHLKIPAPVIRQRLEGVEAVLAKKHNGKSNALFFSESDVRARVADILSLPTENRDGFFEITSADGSTEKYGTRNAWASLLKVSVFMMYERLKEIDGISGRAFDGAVRTDAFYSESQLAEYCSDIYDIPTEDHGGTIDCNGEVYISATAVMEKYKLTNFEKVRKMLKERIPSVRSGRSRSNNHVYANGFFHVGEVDALIQSIPRVQEMILVIDGVEYMAARHFKHYLKEPSKDFYIHFYKKIHSEIRNQAFESKKVFCFDHTGELLPFYPLELLKTIHNADA